MTLAADKITFSYNAQTADGRVMNGTIDAPHLDDATHQLHLLGLHILAMQPVTRPARPKPLRSDDFLAFNDQLAHLSAAGLPVEQGLRLLAQDLRKGRLAATIRAVADELDRGVPLADAIEKYRGSFPPLYARLVDAGIKSGDLGGMLINLGRHVETVQRLRASLWQATAYPLMVAGVLAIVVGLLGWLVFPQFAQAFAQMGYGVRANAGRGGILSMTGNQQPARALPLPVITQVLFAAGKIVPWIALLVLLSIVLAPLIWRMLRAMNLDGAFTDAVLVRLPLIGRALRLNLLARWCATLRLAASAGMDLPSALRLAGETVASPALKRDSFDLVAALERGTPLESAGATAMLPAVVPPMIDLASRSNDLPAALEALATMYQQQAEVRVRAIPTILTPILMILVALLIGFVIAGLLSPMLRLIRWISGGGL